MKRTKIILLIIITAGLLLAVYAGKRWYTHESEVNAKLWAIQTDTDKIAESLKGKETPFVYRLGKDYLHDMIMGSDKTDYNAYLKLAAGENINLLIVGDSISAQDWTADIAEQIKWNFGAECNVTNLSMGGNTCYAGYVRTMIHADGEYDLAVICFGQNDPAEDFSTYYEAVIRTILEKNPGIEIMAVLESSERTYTEKLKSIIELAEYYEIALADTIAAYDDSEYSYEALSPDGVHPGELGKELYVGTVMDVLFDHVEKNVYKELNFPGKSTQESQISDRQKTESIVPAMHPETAVLGKCSFIPAELFSRIDDKRYSFYISDFKGVMGIYCARLPGNNYIQFFYNGELIGEYSEEFNHTFLQEMIFLVDRNIHEISGTIDVVFNSTENAESFRGMAFSCAEETERGVI